MKNQICSPGISFDYAGVGNDDGWRALGVACQDSETERKQNKINSAQVSQNLEG